MNDLDALEKHLRQENVAALIVEPIQGKGVYIPADNYLPEAQRLPGRQPLFPSSHCAEQPPPPAERIRGPSPSDPHKPPCPISCLRKRPLRFRRWPPGEFELQRNLFKADEKLVGLMFRAGVPLLAGTDAMNPFCFPGFGLHDELELLVESGLTPLAALQSATLRPAEFLERTDELGAVAPGKRADLVLLSGDPLTDIKNTTRIEAVWSKGTYFGRAQLDGLLAAAKHRTGKGKLH
jgi:hypothetical protein